MYYYAKHLFFLSLIFFFFFKDFAIIFSDEGKGKGRKIYGNSIGLLNRGEPRLE